MNPNTSLRPWLLACGKQFGIREVHEYRYPDADNSPDEVFVTYQETTSDDEHEGSIHDLSTRDGFDNKSKFAQPWITSVQIDLYNDQNGMHTLKAICAGVNHDTVKPYLRHLSLYSKIITNQTDYDDEEINYHHRLVCQFRENVAHELVETNQAVQDVELTLYNGHVEDTFTIF